MQSIRYISRTYAKPYINTRGELLIHWCGEELKVIGILEDGTWVVESIVINQTK